MKKNKLRMLFCSYGSNVPYDPMFLNRFATQFETYLATFLPREQILDSNAKVILLRDFGRPLRHARINNLRIALSVFWRAIQIYRCVNATKPQVLVGSWVQTYGLYAKLSKQKPFILFAYGSDILVDPARSPLHRAITIHVVKSADLVLIDSEVQRRAVLSLGCLPQRIVSFPWFDEHALQGVHSDRTFRNRLGWRRKLIVVCSRTHEPRYSVDTLIRAMPRVVQEAPDVRFLIFGRGSQTPQLIRLAHELNVWPYVYFAGNAPRNQLLRYMKDCDLYVSTSLSDGTSSSLLEAILLGVPVIVTAIEGNREWITDGINGLMFPVRDTEQLARAIVDLAKNPLERKSLQHAARLGVKRRINWESSSQELLDKMAMLYLDKRKIESSWRIGLGRHRILQL